MQTTNNKVEEIKLTIQNIRSRYNDGQSMEADIKILYDLLEKSEFFFALSEILNDKNIEVCQLNVTVERSEKEIEDLKKANLHISGKDMYRGWDAMAGGQLEVK